MFMECDLNKQVVNFTVTIGNIKMEYPAIMIANFCPLWASKILLERNIILDENINLNNVKDFFEGIIKGKMTITTDNCRTILKLGELSGSKQIIEKAQMFINENEKTIPEIINEMIDEKRQEDQRSTNFKNEYNESNTIFNQHSKEEYLSKNYNEMLKYPELLEKIEIPQHYRIVQHALSYYKKDEFNLRGFISFVLDMLETKSDRDYMIFLSLIDFDDFDIKEIERLIKCPNYDENILKNKVIHFSSKMNEHENNIKFLQTQFYEMKEQNKQLLDLITSKINVILDNQRKIIDESKQQTNDIKSQMINLINSHQNLIDEHNQQTKQIIENIKSKNEELIDQQSSLINNLFSNQQRSIEESKLQIKTQTDDIKSQITSFINNHQNFIDEHNQQTKQIMAFESEMKNEIENIKTKNEELINQQSSVMNNLFSNQQRSIEESKLQIKTQADDIKSKLINLINDQQNSFYDLKVQNNIIIKEKCPFITSELKEKIENIDKRSETQTDELLKLIEINNNLNKEMKEIEGKVFNLPSFIMENQGMKNEMNKYERDNVIFQASQMQKIDKIGKEQNNIFEKLLQIESTNNGIALKRDYIGKPFSGILSALTEKHKCNINDKGIISISGNILENSLWGTLSSLVNFKYTGLSYHSKYEMNSYICFDFKDHYISLSAYSLKSSNISDPFFLKSWIVEGLTDKKEWIELDLHVNEQTLCSPSTIHTFHIYQNEKTKIPFRFIRIKLTGPTSSNNYDIELTNIEFFGKYY